MSAVNEEGLSPEELRKRLYQTFKNKGLLDTLKTQLRNQLIQELQSPGEPVPRGLSAKGDSVSVLASNSLVIDHLHRCGYEYTLSVFYPECGLSKDKVFSTRDLLQLLKISPQSPLYTSVVSNVQSGQKGLLMNLLSELIAHRAHLQLRDADTQTSSTPPDSTQSLVEKLQVVDEEYEVLRQKGNRWASVEAKLAEFRKEMEEQARAELKAKLQHFQEVEVSRVRMEEQERSRREVSEIRHRLEKNYELKAEALMSREKNAIERLQKQQEIEEKEVYAQRQALLKEIETVRNREAELRLRTEAFEKTCKLHEEKVKSTEELLRRRELSVKTQEDTYDQKLNNELKKVQLEFKEDYARRNEAFIENERRNKEETARLHKEATILDTKMEEHERALRELKRVQVEMESLRAQGGALTRQNALLRERLDGMSDYTAIRSERLELQAEVHLLKEQLEKKQQENQKLRQELSTPSHEQLVLQAEVRRLETARRLDQEEFQTQREVFQSQLTQEVERCAQLKAQFLECEERTKWMSANAEEIKQQLRLTQLALENEVLRNPKPSLVDRSVLDLNPDKVVPPDVYVDGALLKATVGYDDEDEDVCDPGPTIRGRRRVPRPRSGSLEPETEAVAEALARMRELEKEAETLEEAYRSYQQRAVRAPLERNATAYIRPTAAAQHRVTFDLNAPNLGPVFTARDLHHRDFPEPTSPSERAPPRARSPPPRRLSSTPVSASKTRGQRTHTDQEVHVESSRVGGSAVTFTGLSSERDVSPIPAAEYSHITPPSSPQMKSTARDHCSPPKLQEIISSSSQESSPKPEKISIQDLTQPVSVLSADLHCSLAQLQDGRVTSPNLQPSERERVSPLPSPWRENTSGVTPSNLASDGDKVKEEEQERKRREQEEEEERKRRQKDKEEEEQERRQRERKEEEEQEKRKREREEEERDEEEEQERRQKERDEEEERDMRELEQELQAVSEGGVRGEGSERGGVRGEGSERGGVMEQNIPALQNQSSTDSLQRYMMMVMEGQEKEQREQISLKDDSVNLSQEAAALSESKDDSIAAFSHDEPDDDFW
ncbi:oral-facial-digital syndrome 1 protein homolog isoform X3 [Astyanax mexicanus]|uniref:oral-facial-digital syndrome 1 protein homolog isoform X3 n=1 Tax=Astyanax mexicanus TaxID=7994 RepID=UPI0020CAE069|nr:oral-facial-digital syndrome 1 protein homolog isoform X3 [Astyanax mexicanus]